MVELPDHREVASLPDAFSGPPQPCYGLALLPATVLAIARRRDVGREIRTPCATLVVIGTAVILAALFARLPGPLGRGGDTNSFAGMFSAGAALATQALLRLNTPEAGALFDRIQYMFPTTLCAAEMQSLGR